MRVKGCYSPLQAVKVCQYPGLLSKQKTENSSAAWQPTAETLTCTTYKKKTFSFQILYFLHLYSVNTKVLLTCRVLFILQQQITVRSNLRGAGLISFNAAWLTTSWCQLLNHNHDSTAVKRSYRPEGKHVDLVATTNHQVNLELPSWRFQPAGCVN